MLIVAQSVLLVLRTDLGLVVGAELAAQLLILLHLIELSTILAQTVPHMGVVLHDVDLGVFLLERYYFF